MKHWIRALIFCILMVSPSHQAGQGMMGALMSTTDPNQLVAYDAMRLALRRVEVMASVRSSLNLSLHVGDTSVMRMIEVHGSDSAMKQRVEFETFHFIIQEIFENASISCAPSNHSLLVGLVGPSRSSDVYLLRDFELKHNQKALAISFSATSSSLSNKTAFPYFSR
eukprot:330379-Hanusia_phi.AAC.1